MECDINHCFCCFCATGALPIIQQPTRTPEIFYVGHASEALCIFNILVELTTLLFMMGWYLPLLVSDTVELSNKQSLREVERIVGWDQHGSRSHSHSHACLFPTDWWVLF
jgi:hypothetical protein